MYIKALFVVYFLTNMLNEFDSINIIEQILFGFIYSQVLEKTNRIFVIDFYKLDITKYLNTIWTVPELFQNYLFLGIIKRDKIFFHYKWFDIIYYWIFQRTEQSYFYKSENFLYVCTWRTISFTEPFKFVKLFVVVCR